MDNDGKKYPRLKMRKVKVNHPGLPQHMWVVTQVNLPGGRRHLLFQNEQHEEALGFADRTLKFAKVTNGPLKRETVGA